MTDLALERRKKRSSDPLVALHYQLAQARESGNLDVLVLAESSGLVVAGAGPWSACEELAAYAPFFVQRSDGASVRGRVDSMRSEVEVLPLVVDGQEMILCGRRGRGDGERPSEAPLTHAALGVTRILRNAA